MQLGQVSGSDGATTLSDARAMTVTLRDVTLWVGPGGSLDDGGTAGEDVTDATTLSDDTVQAGDLGFSGHVASMKLATLKDLKGNPAIPRTTCRIWRWTNPPPPPPPSPSSPVPPPPSPPSAC